MNSITLRFPPDVKIATIGEKWYRDEDDSIVATYTKEELELCMAVSEHLSRQKEPEVVKQAMNRFGTKVDRSGF